MTLGDDPVYPPTPDEPPEFNCDICSMLQYLIDKVDEIDRRLQFFEGDGDEFFDGILWPKTWNFEPELSFVPPNAPPTSGTGMGILALFGLMVSIGNLIMQTHQDLKENECCLAMPEHWQLKPEGHRPQLVVQCAEMREDGTLGSAKYVVTIPHYLYNPETTVPPFNWMYKGKYYGVLRLNDNSKVQVYADSEYEARRVLQMISLWIDALQTQNTYIRTGEISNPDFKNVQVFPKYATYYSKGTAIDSEVKRIYWG